MKIKTLVYLVIALILINVAALATIAYQKFSRPDRSEFFDKFRRGNRTPEDMPPPDFRLTDEEREAMARARDNFEENVRPLLDSLADVRKALFVELRLDEPDSAIVNSMIEEQGVLQTKIQKRLVNRFLADRDLIEPKHREGLLRIIEQRSRGSHFWGRGKFGGGKQHRSDVEPDRESER